MKKSVIAVCMVLGATFMPKGALAIDTSNQGNVNELKAMLFSENVKPGDTLKQTGKSSDGETCTLKMYVSRYGVTLSLVTAGNGRETGVGFRASISGKTSSHYEVLDSDEGMIEINQIALAGDERGDYADRQHLKLLTAERPGERGIDNVVEITISNQTTDAFKTSDRGTPVPDFSKAEPKTEISCSFR